MSEPSIPWSETIRLSEVVRFTPADPLKRHLEPDDATRKRIAKALDLVSLDHLEADLSLTGWFDGARIEGRLSAKVTQTCGVTLEPFSSDLKARFAVTVVPPTSPHAVQQVEEDEIEIEFDPEAEDPPDVLEGDQIDLAAYVVEHLALEIDPFPRKPDAVFTPPENPGEISPFAVLKTLKTGDGSDRS
ncbi:MAG: DUF177 domain-containing protein [Caulobacteraceae bacterium]|nr:DUF177 domain-containing protein [Caulobacteraceae bacterium]